MRRLLVLAAALLMTPATLAGQVVQLLTGGDTVVSVVVGDSGKVRLEVYGATGGISAYSITIFLDASRVQVTTADSVQGYGLPKPALTPGSDQVTLTASGGTYTGTIIELADVWFKMASAATQGSLISLKVNSLTSATGAADLLPGHRTNVVNLCQANTYWGDVTGEHLVNSRDALVALTYAVGLPVTGFDLSPGDVDADSAVTSRDALLILAYSIRLYVPSNRLGKAKANRCAPLYPVTQDMLFFRGSDVYRIAAGDTLPVKFALPVAPYSSYYRPIWSPDGARVLYTGYTSAYYYEVLASNGTTVDTLTRNGSFDGGADWSPDGTRIAFMSTRVFPYGAFVMDANGSNQAPLTSTSLYVSSSEPVSWSPDGGHVAFVACAYPSGCYNYGIWVVSADTGSSSAREVLGGTLGQSPSEPIWTPAGDSILYRRYSNQIYAVSVTTPGDTGRLVTRLDGGGDWPGVTTVTTPGYAFRSFLRYPYDFYLRRGSDGRYLRIVRGTSAGEYAMSFRWAVPYVQTIAISPKPVTVTVSAPVAITAAVTNSDGANNTTTPLTWVSRNTNVATVAATGTRTANVTGVATGSTYVVVTARGWRSDSVQVTVP